MTHHHDHNSHADRPRLKVLFKTATEDARCGACNRPLRTGIGVRVEDMDTGAISHLGPTCLEKNTGVKHYNVPVVSVGDITEGGASSQDTAQGKGVQKHTSRSDYTRAAHDALKERRLNAIANIELRAYELPARGFRQDILTPQVFYELPRDPAALTTDKDIRAVENRVEFTMRRDKFRAPDLETLQHCMLTVVQIDHLLKTRDKIKSRDLQMLDSFRTQLTRNFGLTDAQMTQIERMTYFYKSFHVPNRIKDIRFPQTEERKQQRLAAADLKKGQLTLDFG
ncbi:MAG: hypothetical protein QF692_07765 [Alphaproteobacteria bacterium]|jgi:hypothetical protein|nr:hypothetical protein [Alphaproteobacteria bacterium]MDP7223143.1 hypothetical protein [Alphaproteobacteria bacterium]